MGPNRTVVFKLESFEGFGGFSHMPKGDLFVFGVNPYNGNVVLRFNDRHENGCAVAEAVLNQLNRDLRKLKMRYGSDAGLSEFADCMEGVGGYEMDGNAVFVDLEKDEKKGCGSNVA